MAFALRVLLVCAVITAACMGGHVDPERVAIRRNVLLSKAESAFHAANARYATATELVQAGLVSREIAENGKRGHRLDLRLTHSGYKIHAKPLVWTRDGRRTFYSGVTAPSIRVGKTDPLRVPIRSSAMTPRCTITLCG